MDSFTVNVSGLEAFSCCFSCSFTCFLYIEYIYFNQPILLFLKAFTHYLFFFTHVDSMAEKKMHKRYSTVQKPYFFARRTGKWVQRLMVLIVYFSILVCFYCIGRVWDRCHFKLSKLSLAFFIDMAKEIGTQCKSLTQAQFSRATVTARLGDLTSPPSL